MLVAVEKKKQWFTYIHLFKQTCSNDLGVSTSSQLSSIMIKIDKQKQKEKTTTQSRINQIVTKQESYIPSFSYSYSSSYSSC